MYAFPHHTQIVQRKKRANDTIARRGKKKKKKINTLTHRCKIYESINAMDIGALLKPLLLHRCGEGKTCSTKMLWHKTVRFFSSLFGCFCCRILKYKIPKHAHVDRKAKIKANILHIKWIRKDISLTTHLFFLC